MLNFTWKVKNNLTENRAHAGMAERLVRDLTIEDTLQAEIKDTLLLNNQPYVKWCGL